MAGRLTKIRRRLLEAALNRIGRRRRRLLAWRAAAGDVRLLTFERNGLVWSCSPVDEYVGFHLFNDGGYQMAEIDALLAWMKRNRIWSEVRDVFVDVGANIGTTCIPLVRAAKCRALAIEPVAHNFRLLETNVDANGLGDRIVLVKKAVQRTAGRVTMQLNSSNWGGNFVWRGGQDGVLADTTAEREEVEADQLSAIVQSAGFRAEEIALVWADVQGSEAEVIESGAPFWRIGVPLWAEIEPHSLVLQGSLAAFTTLAATYFEAFIESVDLVRLGAEAQPAPIAQLESLIRRLTPRKEATDVLLLPRSAAISTG